MESDKMKQVSEIVPDTSQEFDACVDYKETKSKPSNLADFLGIADVPENEEDAWKEHNYQNWREHWVGMPAFDSKNIQAEKKLIINFRNEEDFLAFAEVLKQNLTTKTKSVWWPAREKDMNSIKRWLDDSEI